MVGLLLQAPTSRCVAAPTGRSTGSGGRSRGKMGPADNTVGEGVAVTHWFTKRMAPGRYGLGWLSLGIGLAISTAVLAGGFLGWPNWGMLALNGVWCVDLGLWWYARGYNGPLVLFGLFGAFITLTSLVPRL